MKKLIHWIFEWCETLCVHLDKGLCRVVFGNNIDLVGEGDLLW